MRATTPAALFIVMAILYIMAVASQVFSSDFLQTSSVFSSLLISTLVSGALASVVIEKIDAAARPN
jgi:antibiotic biosynthesis monooxygenase (ABM) superfamily enzyme